MTRAEAGAKLAQVLIKVGHPDTWTDHSDLSTDPADPVGNAVQLSRRRWQREAARLNAPPDRQRWLDVPQSTSAYYNRSTNELALPTGLLLPPWFDPAADLATNLGAIGAVIGYEMGHAFRGDLVAPCPVSVAPHGRDRAAGPRSARARSAAALKNRRTTPANRGSPARPGCPRRSRR